MSIRVPLWAAAILLAATPAVAASTPCIGDCDRDGRVTPSDLGQAVEVALAVEAAAECAAIETSGGDGVTVEEIVAGTRRRLNGCAGPASLRETEPLHNRTDVLRTAWLRLDLLEGIDGAELSAFALRCGDDEIGVVATALDGGRLVVNPEAELPAAAECDLTFGGPQGPERLAFRTAPAGAPLLALFDRLNGRLTTPYPDDVLAREDAGTATGLRLDVPAPDAAADVRLIFDVLRAAANQLDGFSPIAHMVVELSGPIEPSSVPRTKGESLDPLATVGLFDLTQGSPTYGERVPFQLRVGDDRAANGSRSRTLLLFPSVPLTPAGRYGLVITRRAFADASRPLTPSAYFARALAAPEVGEEEVVGRTRALAREVLDVVGGAVPPIFDDDVALVVSISVRSTDDIPRDMVAIREQIWASPPPAYEIDSVAGEVVAGGIGAVVRGRWQAPNFRDGAFLHRGSDGRPQQTGSRSVPFVLVVPPQAASGPVPVTMHQHGNPGSQEEVISNARRFLAAAGFAAIGFTDVLNREIGQDIQLQTLDVLDNLLQRGRMPDHWVETKAEQLAFVRLIGSLGDVDVLPLPSGDGVPDLDLGAPLTYHGISEGANNGQGLVAYAPEIRAAALVVGGARLTETLIHQQPGSFLNLLPLFFPSITPADIWSGFSLFQAVYDVQDNHNHAPFLYRRRLDLGGDGRRASLLVLEGLNDSLVPNHASDSMAYSFLPLPHVAPVQRDTVVLGSVEAPVVANVDDETTAAFYQYVPVGIEGIAPTPSCALVNQSEGHFCPQVATESILQRTVFLQSAVFESVPRVIDPLAVAGASAIPPLANEVAGRP